MDNLETLDIKQLEDELSATESGVITIPYLYEWLMNETENTQKGILLQAECGMGKSTFCETINQLSDSDNVLRFSDAIDGWTEFMKIRRFVSGISILPIMVAPIFILKELKMLY